jgi:hypothetical protein
MKSERDTGVRSELATGSFRLAAAPASMTYTVVVVLKWREMNTCRYTTRLTSSPLQLYSDTVYPYAYPVIPQLHPHFLRLQQRHLTPNSPIAFLDRCRKTWSCPSQFHAHDSLPRKLLSYRRIQEDVAPRAED